MSKEIRFGIIGNVDSGKSTFIGVIKSNKLDDGRGDARKRILKHPHEKKSGRTSCITPLSVKIKNKSLVLIDLAGHEKYLKTTLHGLSGYFIDYSILVIGANMGVSKMTREHLSITMALNIPFIIVITKIDLAPPNIFKETKKNIERMIKKMSKRRGLNFIPNFIDKLEDTENMFKNEIPIFSISNKTGENIEIVKNYLINLKNRNVVNEDKEINNYFSIEDKFQVSGIGTVISGKLLYGTIKKNDKLYLGPIQDEWVEVVAKSFHDNYRNVIEELNKGETGTIAIKPVNKKIGIKNIKKYNKGLVLVDNCYKKHFYKFKAEVRILKNHATTIKENYQPIINCNSIVQTAKIINIDNNDKILRAGDSSIIDFEFCYKPEVLKVNDTFLFREGKTKGIGKIIFVGN